MEAVVVKRPVGSRILRLTGTGALNLTGPPSID